jgi:hypothetical protein
MTSKEKFKQNWDQSFPNAPLIWFLFRDIFKARWFRIHSLPESKRYAENQAEMSIILDRQNHLLTDLFGDDSKIFLVTGDYLWSGIASDQSIDERLNDYQFTRLDDINLHLINAEDYDKGDLYSPFFAEISWKVGQHDELLKSIAEDQEQAFFVCFDKKIIAAPYDGGMDLILRDGSTRDFYRKKYQDWLSNSENGL